MARFIFGSAIVGIIEAYFTQDIRLSAEAMAKQVFILLNKNI